MSAFRWEAVDAQGRVTARRARGRHAARGARPAARRRTDADGGRRRGGARDALARRRGCPPPLVTLTTRQLATLVQSGMPLDQALAAVAEQADDARAAKLVAALRTHVAAGESLPAALARYPRTFSPLYRGLVGAGAETGRLAEVLARLADYLEAREALRQKIVLALIYPAIVTVIAFAVIAVLLVYVVPQVVSVYQQSRQTLPWLTQALIATSAFFRATGWLWLALVVIAVGGVRDRATGARRSARAGTRCCCACRSSARLCAASTRRASRARWPSSSAAARRCCARSMPRAKSCGMLPLQDAARRAAGAGARRRDAVARAEGTGRVSAGADPPGRQRREQRPAGADAGARGRASWSAMPSAGSRGSPRCCSRR